MGKKLNHNNLSITERFLFTSCKEKIETIKLINANFGSSKREQIIPLGSIGILNQVEWEVIGYIERKETEENFWSEYLLFSSQFNEFSWLTEANGHWNIVKKSKLIPILSYKSSISLIKTIADYNDEKYCLFHKGNAELKFAKGKFNYPIKDGEIVSFEDYVFPPKILTCESCNETATWLIGEYINSSVIKKVFGIPSEKMPYNIGISPNQLSYSKKFYNQIFKFWMFFLIFLTFLHLVNLKFAKNEIVYSEKFIYNPNDLEKTKVTSQFKFNNGSKNVEIYLNALINNNWMEVKGNLINDDNGNSIDFDENIEFYTGFDSDGSWSEGSQNTSILLSQVPSGNYHINLEVDSKELSETQYEIVVKRDVENWSNYIFSLILISLFPILAFILKKRFESKQWEDSNFIPW